MKKNAMLKIAAILMVAVLLTTCAISSTFAKYVSSDVDHDIARVAKWGVNVDVKASQAFADSYGSAKVKGDAALAEIDDVLAPGTKKDDAVTITASGTPEVATKVTFKDKAGVTGENAKFITLDGWKVNHPVDGEKEYCPVKFTIKSGAQTFTYEIGEGNDKYATVIALQNAMNAKISTIFAGTYNANQPISADFSISWEWAYDGNNDAYDSLLGDAYSATISLYFDVTIEQAGSTGNFVVAD